jgi:hypothetical protein
MNYQDDLNEIIRLTSKIKENLPQQDLFGNQIVEWGTAKMITEMVLDQFPKARDNDDYGIEMFRQLYTKAGLPIPRSSAELFRRTRQKFQEKGEYEASPEVKEARMKKAEWMKQNVKYI